MKLPSEMQCTRAAGSLSVSSPGHARYLAYIRALVCDSARAVGFDPDEVARIEMAVDEACTNVLKHAYAPNSAWQRQDRPPEIRIQILTDHPDLLIVEINDHGRGFDFAAYDPGVLAERTARMQTNGYGIAIMRRFMDEVTYHSSAEHGNTLRLVKIR